MKPKTKAAKPAKPASKPSAQPEAILQIPLGDVIPSATNRKDFSPEALQQLAASIKLHGIQSPIIARPHPVKKGKYEIVAGERRWRAAGQARLASVPVIVRTVSDAQLLSLQATENLQRENLSALQEAQAYKQMQEQGLSIDQICEQVSKSRSVVFSRLKLLDLPPALQDHLKQGHFNHSVALLLARIPSPKAQEECAKWVLEGEEHYDHRTQERWHEPWSEREVATHISEHYMVRLKGAPFSLSAPDFPMLDSTGRESLTLRPPCTTCPHRTGNMVDAYPDLKKSPDVCTFTYCYAGKVEVHWRRLKAQAAQAAAAAPAAADPKSKTPPAPAVTILEGEAAERALRERNYALLSRVPYEVTPKGEEYNNKTPWKTLVKGQPVPISLARDDQGNIVELALLTDLLAAAAANGHTVPTTASGSRGKTDAEKKAEREQKIFRAARERALTEIVRKITHPTAADQRPLPEILRLLCGTLVTQEVQIYDSYERAFRRRGLVPATDKWGGKTLITPFIEHLRNLPTDEILGLIAEFLLGVRLYEQEDTCFHSACEYWKIDLAAVTQQVRAEFEAAAAKPAKTK